MRRQHSSCNSTSLALRSACQSGCDQLCGATSGVAAARRRRIVLNLMVPPVLRSACLSGCDLLCTRKGFACIVDEGAPAFGSNAAGTHTTNMVGRAAQWRGPGDHAVELHGIGSGSRWVRLSSTAAWADVASLLEALFAASDPLFMEK